jgi:hypothetical protein
MDELTRERFGPLPVCMPTPNQSEVCAERRRQLDIALRADPAGLSRSRRRAKASHTRSGVAA